MTLTNLTSHFVLTETSLTVVGNPTNEDYISAFNELKTINDKSNWYIGDLLNEMELTGKDLLSTIADQVGCNYRNLKNIKSICKAIPKENRLNDVSWTHHYKALYELDKNLPAVANHLQLAKLKNHSVTDMIRDIRTSRTDDEKSTVPDIERNREGILYREAMNSITAIKRFINNAADKCGDTELELFREDFYSLVDLVEEELA